MGHDAGDVRFVELANTFHDLIELDEYKKLIGQIIVMVPVRPAEGIPIELARCLSLWQSHGIPWVPYKDYNGGFLEIHRARMLNDINTSGLGQFNYFLFLDSDMCPDPMLPIQLARHDKPIVSGVAVSQNREFGMQVCFSMKDENGDYRMPNYFSNPIIPAKGLAEVGHAGTGCMLVRRDVAAAFTFEGDDVPFLIPEAIRRMGVKTGVMRYGEDIHFCSQAREKGFSVHVDFEAVVRHSKYLEMSWPDENRDATLDAASYCAGASAMKVFDGLAEAKTA